MNAEELYRSEYIEIQNQLKSIDLKLKQHRQEFQNKTNKKVDYEGFVELSRIKNSLNKIINFLDDRNRKNIEMVG